jgi:DNA-binding NarL/FixJ family response regulator
MSKLLLVDDHAAVRAGLRMMLESGGWLQVDEACDGEQALAKLQRGGYALLVLDAMLQEENGIELASRIRRKLPELPILILTMHSEPALVRAAIRAGVNGYVLKHASAEEVLAAVQSVRFGAFHLDGRIAPAVLADLRERNPAQADSVHLRKKSILAALHKGQNNQEIADLLNLSLSSVKAHLRDLFAEYGVKDRMGLILATQRGGESS